MQKKKIAVVFGTRPEAIKMAPVIREFKKYPDKFETIVITTAQHREMLDQVLKVFNIKPDHDLNIMKSNQSLSDITSAALKGLEVIFKENKPDMAIVHGDTTTSFASALAAFYLEIPIAHVEAGLRTYNKQSPYPEELNRQMIDNLADIYFAPTNQAALNLRSENKSLDNIVVTGNTSIDAIHYTTTLYVKHPIVSLMEQADAHKKWILLTMHRRENYGKPMDQVFKAVRRLVENRKDIAVIMPVHLSPVVQKQAKEIFADTDDVYLVEPLEVDVFHKIIGFSDLVLTDSGGLQEEAPALNVPVLVLRENTERPEGVEAGTLKVVGTEENQVYESVETLLNSKENYEEMALSKNPYGDGFASRRILEYIVKYFEENGA